VVFATNRPLDDWTCQVIEAGAQLTAMVLEVERASDRMMMASSKRQADGAAPLIGSSDAIRRVRERIERVAAADFTVLIEGAIGPEPRLSFIDFSGSAAVGWGNREVERAGENGPALNPVMCRIEPGATLQPYNRRPLCLASGHTARPVRDPVGDRRRRDG
jgi:hypothetical protein